MRQLRRPWGAAPWGNGGGVEGSPLGPFGVAQCCSGEGKEAILHGRPLSPCEVATRSALGVVHLVPRWRSPSDEWVVHACAVSIWPNYLWDLYLSLLMRQHNNVSIWSYNKMTTRSWFNFDNSAHYSWNKETKTTSYNRRGWLSPPLYCFKIREHHEP